MVDNLAFMLYNRQMHEQIAKLEEMRNGNPMPIKLLKEGEAEERQVHEGNDREDRQEFIPYIMPDAVIINKDQQG